MNPNRPTARTASAPEGLLAGIVSAWNRFWFSPADPLPLGLIRVCTGAVMLYVHLTYSLDLVALLGPDGWVSVPDVMNWLRQEAQFIAPTLQWVPPEKPTSVSIGIPYWSVFFHLKDPASIWAVHVFFLVCMFLFTIGLATRVTAVLSWIAIMSYLQRTPTTLFGMDTIMNVLMIYLMVGPSGARLSVDRLLVKWWARRQGKPEPPVEPSVSANVALRLMQIHFCFIYMASGLSKLQGPAWWNGNALWGTMANYSFAPMDWPLYMNFLRFLCDHRFLWEFIMFGGTYFTLAVEISFPFLVWRPRLRWLMICLSALLHTGIGIIMGLATFSMMMFCLLLAFVPAPSISRFVDALAGLGGGPARRVSPTRKESALAS